MPAVKDVVSIHTINGGKAPFRVRSHSLKNEVGLVDSKNQFIKPPSEMLNGDGDLILLEKDPKFVIRSTMNCDEELSILVLDYHSKVTSVKLTVKLKE